MGNKAGKLYVDENTYSYEDIDDFLVVIVKAATDEVCRKPNEEQQQQQLENSVDSGYNDVSARQSRESSPQHEPTEKEELLVNTSIDHSCNDDNERSNDSKLGQHHTYLGYRLYNYETVECEGNRHITDNDL